MAITWELESEHLGVVRVSGELSVAEMAGVQAELAAAAEKSGAFLMLLLLESFEGWATEKGWADTSFTDENDENISKMAFVGDERWRDEIYIFTLKGMRPVAIEYFGPDEELRARQWLEEK